MIRSKTETYPFTPLAQCRNCTTFLFSSLLTYRNGDTIRASCIIFMEFSETVEETGRPQRVNEIRKISLRASGLNSSAGTKAGPRLPQ